MRRWIGGGLILLMIGVLVLRGREGDARFERQIYVMGTLVTITLRAPHREDEDLATLVSSVESELNRFQQRWSPQGSGPLAQLNKTLADNPGATVPEGLRPLLAAAKSVADDSQGTFDPGLGALVQLWGFDDPEHFRETPPPDAELAAALERPHRLARAQLTADRLEVGAPGLMLDFGAMAKGAAVGAALQQLRDAGIEHAMVNAGGDLQVIGHAESRPWRIAVRHPRPPEEAPRLLVALELEDGESVFTSGDYERYFEHAGRRYHHVLDPRSGDPSTGAQSSTVVHGDPALADALATALFVGGPDQFHALVDEFALKYAMLVDADGRIHATPGFRHRAQWLTDVQFAPDPVAP